MHRRARRRGLARLAVERERRKVRAPGGLLDLPDLYARALELAVQVLEGRSLRLLVAHLYLLVKAFSLACESA
jgi:hypothetical protein